MKILITGSDGSFGWGFKKQFSHSNHDVIYTDKKDLDITDIDNVMNYASIKPDLIIHLAAITDHHWAENNKEISYAVNQGGAENMAILANELDVPILYVGTCGMFDGKKYFYTETDDPSPLNVYSASKLCGELSVRAISKKAFIIRSGWGMGGGPFIEKKFVGQIYKQIQSGAKVIYAIKDVYGSPTYTPEYAWMAMQIVKHGDYGIWHVANTGEATRADVAKWFVHCLKANVAVEEVTYDEYHKMNPLKVPYTKNEVLCMHKLQSKGFPQMRHWKEAVKEYTDESFISNK